MDLKQAIEARCHELKSDYVRLFNQYGGNAVETRDVYERWCSAEEDLMRIEAAEIKYLGYTVKHRDDQAVLAVTSRGVPMVCENKAFSAGGA